MTMSMPQAENPHAAHQPVAIGDRAEFIRRMIANDRFDPQLLEGGDEVRVMLHYSDTDGWREHVLPICVAHDGTRFVEFENRRWFVRCENVLPPTSAFARGVNALTLERMLPRLDETQFERFAVRFTKAAADKAGRPPDHPSIAKVLAAARMALVDGADIETVRRTHFPDLPPFERPRWVLQLVYDGFEKLLNEDTEPNQDAVDSPEP
jgi:hypothetical protein